MPCSGDGQEPCIPYDLLDRLLIVHTKQYDRKEVEAVCLLVEVWKTVVIQIVRLRAEAEGVTLSKDALDRLSKIGKDSSLRYVMQLLTPANVLAKLNGRDSIWVCVSVRAVCFSRATSTTVKRCSWTGRGRPWSSERFKRRLRFPTSMFVLVMFQYIDLQPVSRRLRVKFPVYRTGLMVRANKSFRWLLNRSTGTKCPTTS